MDKFGQAALLFSVLFITGCWAGPSEAAPDFLAEWSVEAPTLVLGSETQGPDFLFSRIRAVRLLNDGSVAVADGGSNTIRLFEPSGSLAWSLGGQGDGPGEFQWVKELRVLDPDTLLVYDSQLQRLTRFLSSGELLAPTLTFRVEDGRPEIYLGRTPSGDHVLAWIRQVERDRSRVVPDLMRIAVFSSTGAPTVELTSDRGMRRRNSPVPFSPHFSGAMVGEVVYHGDGATPTIRRTSILGEAAAPIDLPITSLDVNDARAQLRATADTSSLRWINEALSHPGTDSVPAYSTFFTDSDDRVWVKAYSPGADSHALLRPLTGGPWLVVDPSGTPIARVAVPEGFRLLDVRGDLVAGVARDDFDVERIEVRRLRVSSAS